MKSEPSTVANVKVGKADVKPTAPSHISGVKEGNKTRMRHEDLEAPSRSTGINPKDRMPIDPRMPKISPP